jgi:hypothetical protein
MTATQMRTHLHPGRVDHRQVVPSARAALEHNRRFAARDTRIGSRLETKEAEEPNVPRMPDPFEGPLLTVRAKLSTRPALTFAPLLTLALDVRCQTESSLFM